jgi:hypothetical protein
MLVMHQHEVMYLEILRQHLEINGETSKGSLNALCIVTTDQNDICQSSVCLYSSLLENSFIL